MKYLAFFASILVMAVQAHAQMPRVDDRAEILSVQQRAKLEALSWQVDRETTAEIAVVTVDSLDGKTIDQYANDLFNELGIGKEKVNNGVLLLVAPLERRVRIEVGYGLEQVLSDSRCGEIRDSVIIPRFQANDYPGGIVAGTKRIAAELRANPQAAHGVPGSGPLLLRTKKREAWLATVVAAMVATLFALVGIWIAYRRLYNTITFAVLSAIVIAVLVMAGFIVWRWHTRDPSVMMALGGIGTLAAGAWGFNWTKYRRFGPHGCSKCGTHLQLLSEQADDPKLLSVQLLEEKLGSVDYDVWVCPACLNTDTERYVKAFSGFCDCPACKARTFKRDPQTVLVAATEYTAGRARVDGRCVSCNHKTVEFVTIPRIVRSQSSSSGSGFSGGGGGGGGGFGGGRSGGGGASGGW